MISVVVPTYNNAEVLSKSLMTWVGQTMSVTNYEVLVVDNNSKDNTANVIKGFAAQYSNIHYLLETKPCATHACHAGARVATGDILVFADDDGLYDQNSLISKVLRDMLHCQAVNL